MKKLYILLLIVLIFSILCFSFSYAEENGMIDDIKNAMSGAENTIENAGQKVMDGTKNIISDGKDMMQNAAEDMGNNMKNDQENINQDTQNTIENGLTNNNNNNNNNDYTAIRTANDNYNGSFLGMNPTMWTWIIMAAVGVSIIVLVWIYGKEHEKNYND